MLRTSLTHIHKVLFPAARVVACYIPLLILLSCKSLGVSLEPVEIEFINNGTGPDGPWTYLKVPTDFPPQNLAMFPSFLETSLIVNASACQPQTAQCPIPTLTMWTGSGAHDLYLDRDSGQWNPGDLKDLKGGYVVDLMELEGDLRYTSERFTLQSSDGEKYLDDTATAVADNVTVGFPNGAFYTLGIGYMSLYGGRKFTYDLPNGTHWTLDLHIYNGFRRGAYPSLSYGLHVGSALHEINGRLFLGGYDRARCIGEPITVQSNSTFHLADLSLGVAGGSSAFLNNDSNDAEINGLLRTNASRSSLPLSARPDPGVPYLYLPGATCDAIAAHLPVSYNSGLGLYLWNTDASEYQDIITSPHFLSFHFNTSGTSGTTASIEIPFALLNLTLTFPIVNTDTQYFPCRPYTPSDNRYPSVILGRAFLQGAHLAQNWETGFVWLSQAPGPSYSDADVKTIDSDSTTLSKLPLAGHWNSTWENVLKPLSGTATQSGDAAASSTSESGSGGLSTGARAGIGVGAALGGAALLALICGTVWWRRRGRRAGVGQNSGGNGAEPETAWRDQSVAGMVQTAPEELEANERQELPAQMHQVKELPSEVKRHELPGPENA